MSSLDHSIQPSLQPTGRDLRLSATVILLAAISCLILYWYPYKAVALLSIALLLFISLWRWEFALAFLTNGFILVGFTWQHLGITGLSQPLLAAIVALGLAAHLLIRRPVFTRSFLYKGVLLLLLLIAVSLIYSSDRAFGSMRLARYLMENILIFSVIFLAPDIKSIRRLLQAILCLGLIIALFSFIEILVLGQSLGHRYGLASSNPIWFSRGIGLTAILLIALGEIGEHPLRRLFRWVALVPLIFLMATSGSRGPMLALSVTLAIYVWWNLRKRGRVQRILAILVLLVGVGLFISQLSATELVVRISNTEAGGPDVSALERLSAYGIALQLFLQHPFFGVGAGGFRAFYVAEYPHNIELEFLAEYGLVGTALFIALIVAVIKLVGRTRLLVRGSLEAEQVRRCFVLILIYASINAQVSGAMTGNGWLWLGAGGLLALKASLEYRASQPRMLQS